jgi:hypothetical protein
LPHVHHERTTLNTIAITKKMIHDKEAFAKHQAQHPCAVTEL